MRCSIEQRYTPVRQRPGADLSHPRRLPDIWYHLLRPGYTSASNVGTLPADIAGRVDGYPLMQFHVGGVSKTRHGLVSLFVRAAGLWSRFAHALGEINARVLLTLLFAVVLVPLSLFWRLAGRDPLLRHRHTASGWSPYPPRYRDRTHYRRMY
jgi:hypothetical protein